MLRAVVVAIEHSPLSDTAKQSMWATLPWLSEIMGDCALACEATNVTAEMPLVYLAATSRGGVGFCAQAWPLLDPNVPCRNGAAEGLAIAEAIEGGVDHKGILKSAACLLGDRGIRAASEDWKIIASRGELPAIVILAAIGAGDVSVVVTVAALERQVRVLH